MTDINNELESKGSNLQVRIVTQADQSSLLYLNACDFIEDIEEAIDVDSWNSSFMHRGGI